MLIFQNMLTVSCENAIYTAKVNVTYYNNPSDPQILVAQMGVFGEDPNLPLSHVDTEPGRLVHVLTTENKTDACHSIVNAPKIRWVALVERGICNLSDKVSTCSKANASAAIIYNNAEPDPKGTSYNLKGNSILIQYKV